MHILIQYPETTHARPAGADGSDLFLEALRNPSNLELDWLWLAAQLTRESEQAYCFQQALQINPRSILAQRGLAQLEQRPAARLDFKGWWRRALQER